MANMIGLNGKAAEIIKAWIGDANGKAQEIAAGWIGDASGKAQMCFSSGLNIFVAAANTAGVAHSSDGVTWTLHAITLDGAACSDSVSSIAYGKGIFVASMWGALAWSTDGINFFTGLTEVYNMRINYGGGKFVAWFGGLNGTSDAYYSVDGKSWTALGKNLSNTAGAYKHIRASYENGIWYVCGHQYFQWSKDGITWTLTWGTSNVTYYSIVYAFGKWWRIGKKTGGGGEIAYSTDGTSFTILSSSVDLKITPNASAYGNDVIAIVGHHYNNIDATYMTSDGSVNATNLDIGLSEDTQCIKQVVFNEKFVAVAPSGYIPYSLDGKTWTKAQPLGSGYTFEDICYTVDE